MKNLTADMVSVVLLNTDTDSIAAVGAFAPVGYISLYLLLLPFVMNKSLSHFMVLG